MNEPTRGAKSPFLHCPPPQNILGTGFRGSMKHRKSEEGETEFQNTFGQTLRGVDFHVYSSNTFMNTFVLSFRFCRCLIDEYGNTTKAPTTRCSRLTRHTLCACAYWAYLNWNTWARTGDEICELPSNFCFWVLGTENWCASRKTILLDLYQASRRYMHELCIF